MPQQQHSAAAVAASWAPAPAASPSPRRRPLPAIRSAGSFAADLPRITPGAGRWGATEPKTTLDVVGSLCEAINLKTVAGTQSVGQRTLLLADDSNAPQGFGVDQVVYTFADAKGVSTLANKLDKNLTGCADRAPTASVTEGPTVKGTGADGAKISGSTYLVTQKTGHQHRGLPGRRADASTTASSTCWRTRPPASTSPTQTGRRSLSAPASGPASHPEPVVG